MLLKMKRLFLTLAVLLTIGYCYAFDGYAPYEIDTIYSYGDVDTKPIPVDGMESLYKKWNSIVKYPTQARRNGTEGRVFLSFTIDEAGKLGDIKLEQGIGHGCDQAAIDALRQVNLQWTPGTMNGEKVKVKMFLPFTFKLK